MCRWFTNLDIKKRHEKLILWKEYTAEEFPKYDNYDAINVDKVSNIPCDYCESWEVTESEFKNFPAGEWEITREGELDGEKSFFIIPAAGTELRRLLHEHADGYREEIEKEMSKRIQKNINNDRLPSGRQAAGRQKDTATASSERRLPSLINTTQNNLKSSDMNTTSTETEALELSMDNLKQEAAENINELSSERYCNGATGVPITFLDKYNPEQFEIIKFRKGNDDKDLTYTKAKLDSVQASKQASKQASHYSVLQDTYQKDTVTESLEHQSPSLINTTQNNLKSLERQNQKEKDLVTDCGLQNQESHSLLSASSENISVCLQERYCNGIAGVPITFLDKYSPEQFEIVNANDYRKTEDVPVKPHGLIKDKDASITFSETQKSIDKKESKNIIAKSRAEQSRAEQSRAEQSRAEQRRTVYARICIRKKL